MKANMLLALAAGVILAAPLAEARVTRIEIDPARSQSPTFGGFSWPGVGQYEKIVGKAFGEVNPHDRKNRDIVDIELAPRNSRGNVEYSFVGAMPSARFPACEQRAKDKHDRDHDDGDRDRDDD